jgi:hypothetical protein
MPFQALVTHPVELEGPWWSRGQLVGAWSGRGQWCGVGAAVAGGRTAYLAGAIVADHSRAAAAGVGRKPSARVPPKLVTSELSVIGRQPSVLGRSGGGRGRVVAFAGDRAWAVVGGRSIATRVSLTLEARMSDRCAAWWAAAAGSCLLNAAARRAVPQLRYCGS